MIGECKWSRKKVGLSVLRGLEEKVQNNGLPHEKNMWILLFSRSGFSADLSDEAYHNKKLKLVSLAELNSP